MIKRVEKMDYLMIDIIEYTPNEFPGFVLCKFFDYIGKVHYFNEKISVIYTGNINENSVLPQKGYVAGEIINRENSIIKLSTMKPYAIETIDGLNIFFVSERQILNEIEKDLIEKIKYIIDNANAKPSDDSNYINLCKQIHKIIMEYKNKEGTQRKAYDIIMELYKLYNDQGMEEKMDFAADVLDMIIGWIGNKEYLRT
jgi:hypothetical protein